MNWQELKDKLLSGLDGLRKRKPIAIKVRSGTQKFWVKNPKKMNFWIKMAEHSARGLSEDKTLATVQVLKVEYGERQTKSGKGK